MATLVVSYSLNTTKPMTEDELCAFLAEQSPMDVVPGTPFEVSTERWDIFSTDGKSEVQTDGK